MADRIQWEPGTPYGVRADQMADALALAVRRAARCLRDGHKADAQAWAETAAILHDEYLACEAAAKAERKRAAIRVRRVA